MLNIQVATRREFHSEDLWAMHKLRAKVFKGRMGWEVPIMSGMEIDGYDAIDPFYMLIKESDGGLRGCWRMLPTEGPYMLKDSFPELLHGQDAPKNRRIWELSRFAVESEGQSNFGFSDITLASIREMLVFGHKMNIVQYVTVTTTAIERMLRRSGVVITRIGPPIRIGVENAVALYADVEASYDIFFGSLAKAA